MNFNLTQVKEALNLFNTGRAERVKSVELPEVLFRSFYSPL